MSIFKHNNKTVTLPDYCKDLNIKVESSICTGEKTIGFYDPNTKRLLLSELVTCDKDIINYYKKYGRKYY